jgi:hypothetical protein
VYTTSRDLKRLVRICKPAFAFDSVAVADDTAAATPQERGVSERVTVCPALVSITHLLE